MCMSCGCGNVTKRTLPRSITLSDLQACADDMGESIEEVIFTILDTYQDYPELMQSDDDDSLPTVAPPFKITPNLIQSDYDDNLPKSKK